MEPKISVIIPAYNAEATIARALDAVSRQDYPHEYEIIVVDDGSIDQTPEIVQAYPNVRYLRQENAGPACARNVGAKMAKGEYLAFTDSDCIPHQNWISYLMYAFERTGVDVVAGSYGIANTESRLARCIHQEIIFRHTRLMPDYPKSFGSYNFCVKRNVFDAVGGFNTTYRNASGEDNDLSYKIIEGGYRIFLERSALVGHHHPTDASRYLNEQYRHGLWRVKMYLEHPKMISGDGYTFWKDIIELPLSVVALLWIVLSGLGVIGFTPFVLFYFVLFLLFELSFAFILMRDFFDAIFFGFLIFFRSFARMFGFSTGIFVFFLKNGRKKFK